jgi:hypothetical protein
MLDTPLTFGRQSSRNGGATTSLPIEYSVDTAHLRVLPGGHPDQPDHAIVAV